MTGLPANPSLIPWSPQAAGDRLSSTLFIAGLIHGVLILGISFSGERDPVGATTATSLEVVIVTSDYEHITAPDDAKLLAQKSLHGAGNILEDVAASTAAGRQAAVPPTGQEQPGLPEPRQHGQDVPSATPVMNTTLTSTEAVEVDVSGTPDTAAMQLQAALPDQSRAIEILSEPDLETRLSDTRLRELEVSANTRESRIAAYLRNWKSKVERIGTLNFPPAAHAGPAGNPILEVAIDADGTLRDVVILSSSGQRVIDQAAMEILKIAAPFEPFPEFLRRDYDVLRFTYEWQFNRPLVSRREAGGIRNRVPRAD